MRQPVVMTTSEWAKGERIFGEAGARYEWIVSQPEEERVAEALATSGARAAVLGVRKYSGALYEALAANAHGGESLIVRYGVGYDSLDLGQLKSHRILLAITRGALDRSVAEHTMALMLGCARNIGLLDSGMRAGGFSSKQGIELYGKTLGLVGLGMIGSQVARMAAFGFGMKVVACDACSLDELLLREKAATGRNQDAEGFLAAKGLSGYTQSFDECASQADILSLHIPVMPATLRFMDARRFALMKAGSYFINTSRGALVDEVALYDAVVAGKIAGAGLDVFAKEPYEPVSADRDLRTLPQVLLTSHTASNTLESNSAMQRIILRNLDGWFAGEREKLSLVPLP